MRSRNKNPDFLTSEIILQLYKSGVFLMAKKRDDEIVHFINPDKRALLPIKNFHCPKSLKRFCKKRPFEISVNKSFKKVINYCAKVNRTETWINKTIEKKFIELHQIGFAHSIECWEKDYLVGGIYGVAIGGCFFAESMFSKKTNASKLALLYLVSRLHKQGYTMLDVQFVNNHLKQFGVYEIPNNVFKKRLIKALSQDINFQSGEEFEIDPFLCVLNFLHSINTKS